MSEFLKTALIGHPVSHSKSPLIHNYWIKKYGLSGEYGAFDIRPENLEEGLSRLAREGYSGFNLTLPHKERALAICDEADATARAVGAVNTIAVRDKKLYGMNTDVFGFTEHIEEGRAGFDFTAGPAVLLGAGGAAKAVLQGLIQQKAPEIWILNRTREKAEEMAFGRPNAYVFDWNKREDILSDANILVNATSLGLEGKEKLEIDLKNLNPGALVNDIVYVPLYTELLKQAQARGNPVVTGIGMLLHQARPAFRSWFGVMPDVDADLLRLVQK